VSALVRVCPVCDTENPPASPRCACGGSLVGVDFSVPREDPPSLRKQGPGDVAPLDSRVRGNDERAPEDASSSLQGQGPSNVGASDGDVAPLDSRDRGYDEVVVCPHADCGQPNPPGATRCLYCNRPLTASSPTLDARPLPPALRARYRIVEVFPASGSEADILLVADAHSGERSVVKLYRKGVDPDFRLLDILAESAGTTVVRVLEHGVSEGVAYERLEYVPGGTLDAFLREGPLASADVRRIVSQIADALQRIHAHRILHRDLKPENVLVRSRDPLALALTDFGIASLAAATQHFTSAARTTKYAAPEVLTGVIDEKADWWSLGMIALEAATGRHPFDGLTEQVMNHQLATRPVDVRGVYDDALRTLCRGLLLRDPRRRFGADEVMRWLAGDASLVAPEESDAPGAIVKPYRIGGAECTNAAELAVALARHWDDARKDLARGTVARWLEQELADYNLLRTLRDLQEDRSIGEDTRVLRFLRAACPTLPPVWRGAPLDPAVLRAKAQQAVDGDGDAIRWLDSVFRDDVLGAFPQSRELATANAAWRAAWQRFEAAWQEAAASQARARVESSRRSNAQGGHVDFDTLVFGQVVTEAPPAPHDVHGPLLLAVLDARYADALRAEVAAERARVVDPGSWLDAELTRAQDDPAALLAARGFLALAASESATARKRHAAAENARTQQIAELREALCTRVASVLDIAPEDDDIGADVARRLDEEFARVQEICQRMRELDLSGDAHAALRTNVEKIEVQGLAVQHALAELARDRGVTRIFTDPSRLAIVVFALVIALLTRNGWVILVVLAVPGAFFLYRWYTRFQMTDAVLAALRRFRLPARSFVREAPARPPAGDKKARGAPRA